MNEIIDFLKKEDTPIVKSIFVKKKNVIVKDITQKVDLAKKNEEQITKNQRGSILTRVKPLKEIKTKNKTIWL